MKSRETVARELQASLQELKQVWGKSKGLFNTPREEAAHKVVRTEYGKGGWPLPLGYYCPSPISDLVVGGRKRGRLFKGIVEPGKYDQEYGFNEEGGLIRVLYYHFRPEPEVYYEDYAVWEQDRLHVYRYERHDGQISQIARARFADGKIAYYEEYDGYQYFVEEFQYANDLLISAQWYNFDTPEKDALLIAEELADDPFFKELNASLSESVELMKKTFSDIIPGYQEQMEQRAKENFYLSAFYYAIEMDTDGKINRLLCTQCDWETYDKPVISYCRPKKGRSMKALEELLIEKLIRLVPESVRAYGIKEPAYGVVLMYDMEGNDPLPPEIGVGLQREYEKFGGDPLMCWNGAELENYFPVMGLDDDQEMQSLCAEYNARIHETGRYHLAVKFYNRLCDCLRKLDWGSILTMAEGFDIKAVDFECSQIA